jgi:hypothetical protein
MAGPARYLASAAVILALAAGCGQARAGTALPKGEDASSYVGAKFEQAMAKLTDKLKDTHDAASSVQDYFRVDDKYAQGTLTAARVGSPESRIVRNRGVKNPDEVIDTFTPAEGAVEYTYLGPAYRSLAPTAWVSTPKPEAGLASPCRWPGLIKPCNMANAVRAAYGTDKRAVKSARSTGDGKTELTVDVTLDTFLEERVITLPTKVREKVTDDLRKGVIPTVITLNSDGSPTSFVMDAKLEGDGHKVELRFDFKFTDKATAQDLPKIPDAAQVTVLDQAGAVDFDRRVLEFQAASG